MVRWFPAGSFFFVSVAGVLRFQPPPVEPCVRFSRTRLTDVVHRRHSVFPARLETAWVRRSEDGVNRDAARQLGLLPETPGG